MDKLYLTDLEAKKTATIKKILGGQKTVQRLEALGIRPGEKITKISSHFWKGPVTVKIGTSKVAIGHGMAQKIVLEVN